MREALKTSGRRSSHATGSVISSRAGVYGATRRGLQDGRTTNRLSRCRVRASRSPRQARSEGLLTSGTSGQQDSTSSSVANLVPSLESRLRQRLDLLGSTLFSLTWKRRDTPQGRSICALRASGHRTSDSGFTGWPTPMAGHAADNTRRTEELAFWRTPMASDGHQGTTAVEGHQIMLHHQAKRATDVRRTASGRTRTGCPAVTAKHGQLNPDHSRWLMGCPPAFVRCLQGFNDWQRWQNWMESLSPAQRTFALRRSSSQATLSTRSSQRCSSRKRGK